MKTNAIAELARKALEKRMGTYGYIKKDNVYIPYTDGFEDGYKKGLEAKINTSTISDCPSPDAEIKIRELSQKVYDLQKANDDLRERCRLEAEQAARDIRTRFPC